MKRVGILTWILGWRVYSYARSISKIKDNLHTLQKQNQLQDKQIKHLAKFLNSTMHQVSRHSEMLYEMDTKMFKYIGSQKTASQMCNGNSCNNH